jgi:hypothetical protein
LLADGIEPTRSAASSAQQKKDRPRRAAHHHGRVEVERKEAIERGNAQRAEAEAYIQSVCKEHNLDFEVLKQKAKSDAVGPPKFSAEGELTRLRQLVQMAEADGADAASSRPSSRT